MSAMPSVDIAAVPNVNHQVIVDAKRTLSFISRMPPVLLTHCLSFAVSSFKGLALVRRVCCLWRHQVRLCPFRFTELVKLSDFRLKSLLPDILKTEWMELSCRYMKDNSLLSGLTALRKLTLWFRFMTGDGATALQFLSSLTALQELEVQCDEHCIQFQSLSALPVLRRLTLGWHGRLGAKVVRSLQSLPPMPALEQLSFCKNAIPLQFLPDMPRLQQLDLVGCTINKDLSLLTRFPELRYLNLMGCRNTTDTSIGLQNLPALPKLQHLDLRTLKLSDVGLLSLSPRTALQTLLLGGYRGQISNAGLQALPPNLQKLDASKSPHVQNVQAFSALTKLQELNLSYCNSLTSLQMLTVLTNLKVLSLSHCRHMTGLLPTPLAVETLYVAGCSITHQAMQSWSSLSLQSLNLNKCRGLDEAGLQLLSALTTLQILQLKGCEQITDSHPFSSLTALRELDLGSCKNLTDTGLKGLAPLTALSKLNLVGCGQITAAGLQSVHSLAKLLASKQLSCNYSIINDIGSLQHA